MIEMANHSLSFFMDFLRLSKGSVLWTAIALLLCAYNALGLDANKRLSQYIHTHWGTEEGLPQASIQAITQTQEGYLWFGTQEGLVRFDGLEMRIFESWDTEGLVGHFVHHLMEDEDGWLWIATRNGVSRFRDGLFENMSAMVGAPQSNVFCTAQTPEGTIWLGANDGLYRFDGENFEKVELAGEASLGGIQTLFADDQGYLWVGTFAGLFHYHDGYFEPFNTLDGLLDEKVHALFQDSNGRVWIGTSGGLNYMQNGRLKQITERDGLVSNNVMSLAEDSDGVLWVGTDQGLSRIFQEVILEDNTLDRFSHLQVRVLLEDTEGGLWVGSEYQGLHRFRDGYLTCFGEPEGLPNNIVRSVIQDHEGLLWVGTQGGLARIKGTQVEVFDEDEGLSNNRVICLMEDRNFNVWVGTQYGGINVIKADGSIEKYTTEEGLPDNFIRAIIEDSRGRIWVGTFDGGIAIIENGEITLLGRQEGLPNGRIYTLYEDRSGVIWIGTAGSGFLRYQNDRLEEQAQDERFSGTAVYSFHEDRNGDIWIGSDQGLIRYRAGKFNLITVADGLYNSKVFYILEDPSGNFWMSCNKGIFVVSKRQLNQFLAGDRDQINCQVYGVSDGMRNAECNVGGPSGGLRTSNNILWFPTMEGLVRAIPAEKRFNNHKPPVHIESVMANRETFQPDDEIIFGPNLKSFEIEYTALSFTEPEKVQFRYRLEGHNDEWQTVTRRRAFYTNLPPRDYRFHVIAANNDGIWNETGASFSFTVKPTFYQTIWFYILIAAGVFLVGVGIYYWRVHALVLRERRLQGEVEHRTKALRETNDKLMNTQEQLMRAAHLAGMAEIASGVLHNLGNALNSVNVTTSVIARHNAELKVDFFERLVDLINEEKDLKQSLLDHPRGPHLLSALEKLKDAFGKSRDKIQHEMHALDDQLLAMNNIIRVQQAHINTSGFYETADLNELIQSVLETQKAQLKESSIELSLVFNADPTIRVQKSKFIQVLLQLIKNARESIGEREGSTHRQITIQTENIEKDRLKVIIQDSGIGISSDSLERIFFPGSSTKGKSAGFGLHFCANAMRDMKGTIRAYSDGLNKGARFVIVFPREPDFAQSLPVLR